jgi:hypothetical protein
MSKRFLIFIILPILLLTSCASEKIGIFGKADTVKNWGKIGILEVITSPPEIPTFPLIEAGIYKSSYNNIYSDVIILHEKYADSIVQHIGQFMEKYAKSRILYGEKLFSLLPPEVLTLNNIKTYKPFLQNDNFPKVSFPKYALNFYDFSEISTNFGLFSKKYLENYKENIQSLCKVLDLDGLLIGTISVHTVDIGIFGLNGDQRLDVILFFLDKEGNPICRGVALSLLVSGSPGDYNIYESLFMRYYDLSDKLLKKLYLN